MTDEAMRAARLAAMRRSYSLGGLAEGDLAEDWLTQLRRWLAEAEDGGILEPNAMILTTATPDGAPSARTVLLKGLDEIGRTLLEEPSIAAFERRRAAMAARGPA